MKKIVLIISLFLISIPVTKGQQKPSQTEDSGIIKGLHMTPQQRKAMRDTIIIFRGAKLRNTVELRMKLLAVMKARQQMKLRRWHHKAR